MCLAMPIHTHELINTLEMMEIELIGMRRKMLRSKPRQRTSKERQTIEKAKSLLMERNNLSEEEAH